MAKKPALRVKREVVRTKRINGVATIDVLSCGHEVLLYTAKRARLDHLAEERFCQQCAKEGRLK